MPVEIEGKSTNIDNYRPRWAHWKERQYARAWCAVLLTLNIEPNEVNRKVLKEFYPSLYQDYLDRVAVIRARIGMDIFSIEDHAAEGRLPAEKIFELSDCLAFAKDLGWKHIEEMEIHFSSPGQIAPVSPKKERGQLKLMHAVLTKALPGFKSTDPGKSAGLLKVWLGIGEDGVVQRRTLISWIKEMDNAVS